MTSYCSRIVLLLLVPGFVFSQIVDDVIVQPALNVSWDTGSRWTFNSVIEQRSNTEILLKHCIFRQPNLLVMKWGAILK
jgi:hypothetical protein